MSKHTPGPWQVDFGVATNRPFVFSMDTGEHIVPVSAKATEAYCRLIAAAPELLEALKSLREAIRNAPIPVESFDLLPVEKADQAIRKAEAA